MVNSILLFSCSFIRPSVRPYSMADVRSSIVAASRSRAGWIQQQQQQALSPAAASTTGATSDSDSDSRLSGRPASAVSADKELSQQSTGVVVVSGCNSPNQGSQNIQITNPVQNSRPTSCTKSPKLLVQSSPVQLNGSSSCGTGICGGTGSCSTMVHPPPKKLGSKVSSIASLFQQQVRTSSIICSSSSSISAVVAH